MTYTKEGLLRGETILINKPLGWTSFRVVSKLRGAIRAKYMLKTLKVGHAGTLDPLATGLLILCTGKSTKHIANYQELTKEYTGVITLGSTTPSYDLETEIDATYPIGHISTDDIYAVAKSFVGEIAQFPPIFSALKKDGKRLYEYARNNQEVAIAARNVHIFSFDITEVNLPLVSFRVSCSKGTYVRSLAYDFGKALGSGAHLSALCRTKIGQHTVEEALPVERFIDSLS